MSVPETLGVLRRTLQVSSGYYNIKFPSSQSRAFSSGECSPEQVNISILHPAFCEFKKVEVTQKESAEDGVGFVSVLTSDRQDARLRVKYHLIPLKLRNTSYCESDTGNGEQLYECPICSLTCTNLQFLEEHVDLHLEEHSFSEGGNMRDLELAQQLQHEEDKQQRLEEEKREKEEFKKLQRQYGLDSSGGYKQQFLKNMEREVDRGRMQPFEYHKRKADMMESLAVGIDDGKTKTSGVIEALCKYYQNENKDVRRVWLSAGVDHFHSSLGDKGWGCGYRNFQMLLSSLLQNSLYNDCLRDTALIPSIPKIQSMIEDAWKEGFDPHGASHFNNRLRGSKAWIGACEIYSLLTSLRIKCQIIDFHKPTGPAGTHPRLFEWILRYYSTDNEGATKVVCTSRPPVYLQHQGHSRTVVGIEEKKNKTLCLLLFDPGCPSQEMQKLLKQSTDGTGLKLLRRFVGGLKEKQYQIVAVDGILTLEEKTARCHASRVLTSEKIP